MSIQYNALREEVLKRGADPSNIHHEIIRLVAIIRKDGEEYLGRRG